MQITESLGMAVTAIRSNKLRAALTLLGIGVGVFSIIGVMTAMGVLQNAIQSGLSDLGANTFQIQKFPAMSFDHDHFKYHNRKNITYEQGELFQSKMPLAKNIGLETHFGIKQIVYGKLKTNPNVGLVGETEEGFPTNNWTIKDGRAFTSQEVTNGAYVCVLMQQIVDKLFPTGSPIGEEVRVDGVRYRVVGTIEPKGSALGGGQDNQLIIPITTGMQQYGKLRSINIMVQTTDPQAQEAAIEMSRSLLRTIRKVAPGADDDFEIFSNDSLIKQFNDLTFIVKMGAVGIACIALLAAGVGIMNIMLVSVTERTKEIGIRKALGATKTNVLTQFLSESVIFSQIGGVIGIISGSLLGNVLALIMSAPPIMPWNTTVAILQTPFLDFTALEMNIVSILFCSLIGIVFGVYPAWKAANLDPIESLRYE
ncbi:MAG: ABC transporter permease [Ignavibacteriales bacterium]|nr:ABC transporter permease [Ignavibacteriales bacterium]